MENARTANYSRTTITELMIPSYANFGGKIHGGIFDATTIRLVLADLQFIDANGRLHSSGLLGESSTSGRTANLYIGKFAIARSRVGTLLVHGSA